MAVDTDQQTAFQQQVERFNMLANELKDEGVPIEQVSAALMMASCNYATYTAAGNEGYLKEGAVNKITAVYRKNLINLQLLRKEQVETKG